MRYIFKVPGCKLFFYRDSKLVLLPSHNNWLSTKVVAMVLMFKMAKPQRSFITYRELRIKYLTITVWNVGGEIPENQCQG